MATFTSLLACVLVGVAVVFQIFSVISAPVVSTIALCTYNGNRFGVFGWCNIQAQQCTPIRVGYELDSYDYMILNDFLPSNAKMSVSKLLIVHPISLVFTFILWILTLIISFHRLGNSRKMLIGMVLWSLPAVLLSLLSFLVDILLFVPQLAWPGWLLLVSTILIAVASSIICVMRRTVSLRKYERLRNNENIEMYPIHLNKDSKLPGGASADQRSNPKESTVISSSHLEEPELSYRFEIDSRS